MITKHINMGTVLIALLDLVLVTGCVLYVIGILK